jgi:hypothetical protein
VRVQTSPSYAREQAVVAVLAGLPHGPELGLLHVEVKASAACGSPDALACSFANRLLVPGEQPAWGPPVEFLIAHEYAHHILAHRRNNPWPASEWGAKRWATTIGICPAVHRHELFLGSWAMPGEAFAESYAMMQFPGLHYPWAYADQLAPDENAEAAIRADVTHPWTGPRERRYTGALALGATRSLQIATPLDGTARITVTGSPRVAVSVLDHGRRVGSEPPRGTRTRVKLSICGQRR